MIDHSFRALFCASLIALLPVESVLAQSARPGNAARTGVSSTRSNNARSGGSLGTSRTAPGGQRQYRSNTELGDAVIQIDPETRSLVIVTDEDTHRELVTVIKTLDKPKPQVLIKVVFLEVTYNKGLDVGVEGNYTFNLGNPSAAVRGQGAQTTTTTSTSGTPATTTASASTTTTTTASSLNAIADTAAGLGTDLALSSIFGAPAAGSFVKLASDDWAATLHLLATRGKLEVLSRPSIMARNNQEAVIVVGSEVPFVTNSRITSDGQTINTVSYEDVGIILRVTPFITSEGTVEMIVAPEISTLTDQTVAISNNASAPVINKRSAETVVVTPHAQTVVIGGLMETQKIESIQKVPILGDIPILGFPFRRTIRDDRKRELLIFLTPYIVNDAKGGAHITSDELAKSELSEKAFTQNDFTKYLDDLPMPTDAARNKRSAATPVPVKKATSVAKPKKSQ